MRITAAPDDVAIRHRGTVCLIHDGFAALAFTFKYNEKRPFRHVLSRMRRDGSDWEGECGSPPRLMMLRFDIEAQFA